MENFSCENSIQKQIREQHWMDLFRPTLNVMNAYCKNEKARQYRKKYNDEHKEQRFEKHDCGCGGKYVNSRKCVHIKTQRHRDWEAAQHAAQTDFVI